MLSRRAMLMTGGAAILVAGGYAGTRLMADAPSVREPWAAAGKGFGDVRLNSLAYAILAPNPHNRQPWWVELEGDTGLTLYCDLTRLLPETDPPNRQITIGLGAFLELYRMAAAEQGYRADITPFPEGEPQPLLDERPIAAVTLEKDQDIQVDPLFAYALRRRTVRSNFTEQAVSEAALTDLAQTAQLADPKRFSTSAAAARLTELKAICADGWKIEHNTKATNDESIALTRVGAREVAENPDGISLYGPQMEAYRMLGFLDKSKMGDPSSAGFKETLKYYNDLIMSARAFGWLSTSTNSRAEQLNAGRDWVRLQLAATKLGLAMHPLSQVLQEFPEMAAPYAALHETLGISEPARVQGLFRFGYAKYPAPAPRWPMVSRIANLSA